MRFTSCISALDMLTLPLVSLSKPVGPVMRLQILDLRNRITPRTRFRAILSHFFFKERVLNSFQEMFNFMLGTIWAFPSLKCSGRAFGSTRYLPLSLTQLPLNNRQAGKDTPKSIPKKVLRCCCHLLHLKQAVGVKLNSWEECLVSKCFASSKTQTV